MSGISLGVRTESAAGLRTYVTLLPLGLRALDAAIERAVVDNPWLELVERSSAGHSGDEIAALAQTGVSLVDHLEGQLAAYAVAKDVRRGARFAIGSLDEDGYLREDAATIALCARVTPADADAAIALVQRLSPAGVGARSLGERFRLQLADAGVRSGLALRLTGLLEQLGQLGAERFAAENELKSADVRAAIERLRACDPHPVRDFAPPVDRVHPEIVIARGEHGLEARVDTRYWPNVRLASFDATAFSHPMRAARREAQLIVDGLDRRRSTLERLATALLEHQRAFFESSGSRAALVPLSGRTLAREIGCAESTISRAISGRFAATPFGTIALGSLIVRSPGRLELTTYAVKEYIREITTATPQFSDEAISRALRLRGIRLARRTVAKYRRGLGVPVSYERRAP